MRTCVENASAVHAHNPQGHQPRVPERSSHQAGAHKASAFLCAGRLARRFTWLAASPVFTQVQAYVSSTVGT